MLSSLSESGLRLALLSNFTSTMLHAALESADFVGRFEQALSTESARTYKPDPRAYQIGTEALNLERHDIVYVAFAAWDAAGAKWFGYPTFWANRLASPAERLDANIDAVGESLRELIRFVA